MTYLNVFEKLKVLFNTLIDYKLIMLFISVVIVLTILYFIKRLNGRNYTKGIVLSLFFSLIINYIVNQRALSKILDNFATEFFKSIYFPSIHVYISIILVLLISTIITVFNKNSKKVYKVINSIAFIVNSTLFILMLNIVATNNINVFAIESLYTNTPAVITLELSTGVFLLWIATLIVAYSTNYIVDRILAREISIEKVIANNIPEVNILNSIESKPRFIPVDYDDVELPKLKQPEQKPIFNYFNLPNNGKIQRNTENIEIFSVDKYNLKFNEA